MVKAATFYSRIYQYMQPPRLTGQRGSLVILLNHGYKLLSSVPFLVITNNSFGFLALIMKFPPNCLIAHIYHPAGTSNQFVKEFNFKASSIIRLSSSSGDLGRC